MKNNFPKISLLLSIIFFIIFVLYFFFLYQIINDNNTKEQQNLLAWQTEASRRDDIRQLARFVEQMAPERALLETHFAKTSDVVPFLDTIEKSAAKVKALAEIDSVNTLDDGSGLLVGLNATGTFEAIYKFLRLLENSPYELAFLSMNMGKSTANSISDININNPQWEVVFKIKLLSFTP
ncbi:MAG: hypothetical protein WCP17_01325 [bacterium]